MKNVSVKHELLRRGSVSSRAAPRSRTAATSYACRQVGGHPRTKHVRAAPTPAHISSQQAPWPAVWDSHWSSVRNLSLWFEPLAGPLTKT